MSTSTFRSAAAIAALALAGSGAAQVQLEPGAATGRNITIARDSAAARVVSVEYQGLYSNVRIESREPGAEPNQHPIAIDIVAMRSLLASLQFPGPKTEPLLTTTELDQIAAPLASALRKATADQDVTFAVSDRHGPLGPLAARAVTTGRVFRRDGQLQVIAGLVRRDFENQFRGTGYLIPFEPGSRAKAVDPDVRIAVEAGAGNNRRPDWAVLWLDVKPAAPAAAAMPAATAPGPVAAPAATAPVTAVSPAVAPAAATVVPAPRAGSVPEAAPAATTDSDTIYRNVSERLKALQRLRDTGLITEPEYQEKRRQILKDM